jgi:RNA polymerase-associated protein RTF1
LPDEPRHEKMADIDDDLLDLAGGDSGDDGSDNESRGRSESPLPVKKKEAKRAPSKKTKRRQDDSEEEEGEA